MLTLKQKAIKRALSALVRTLLRWGVSYREFIALSKELFVESAAQDFGIKGREANTSRVAMLTGIDRKEVKRLRDKLADDQLGESGKREQKLEADYRSLLKNQNRLSRLLTAWHHDPDFSDGSGAALPLFEEGSAQAKTKSFKELVKRYGGDLPYTAVLKECLGNDLIEMSTIENDLPGEPQRRVITAIKRNFEPREGSNDALLRMSSVYQDIGSDLLHNLHLRHEDSLPAVFERRASSAHIPKAKQAAFQALIDSKAQAFLEEIDEWLVANEDVNRAPEDTQRIGLGIYLIDDNKTK